MAEKPPQHAAQLESTASVATELVSSARRTRERAQRTTR